MAALHGRGSSDAGPHAGGAAKAKSTAPEPEFAAPLSILPDGTFLVDVGFGGRQIT
jgi:hypothetical protein